MHESPVLIVEDEPSIQKLIARHLLMVGIQSEPARTAQDALERVEQGGLALVIIDINLGHGESGVDLMAKIRSIEPDLPLVFCTGFPEESCDYPDVPLVAKENGPEVVTKPIDFRDLVTKVKTAIHNRCRDKQIKLACDTSVEACELGKQTHQTVLAVHAILTNEETGLKATRELAEKAHRRTLGEMLSRYKRDPLFWGMFLIAASFLGMQFKEWNEIKHSVHAIERKMPGAVTEGGD